MSRRFGGKYSPDGKASDTSKSAPAPRGIYAGAKVDPAGARANALFFPPIVLGATSLNDGAIGLAIGLVGAGVLLLGAWLLREGLRAEVAYDARKVAKRPAFPRKLTAAVLVGSGTALAVYKSDLELAAPVIFGLAAAGLHLGAFGLDPMKDKGMEGIDTMQQNRVARVVDEGETYLADMTDAIERAEDRQLARRVERFQVTARELFRTVEEDPRDFTSARKFLTVYLMGARDATVKFADYYARSRDAEARADYVALLDDLEQNFAARTRKTIEDDRSDLTVEIEVLQERLEREGVRSE